MIQFEAEDDTKLYDNLKLGWRRPCLQQTSSSTLNSGSLRSILFLWFCNDDDDGDNDDNDGDDDDPSCYIIFVIDYVT